MKFISYERSAVYLICALSTSSCFKGPKLFEQEKGSMPVGVVQGVTGSDPNTVSATLDPNSKVTQTLTVPSSSELSGTSVSFPPGSLGISLDITITTGLAIATSTSKDTLGFDEDVSISVASAPVAILASKSTDLAKPFSLSLSIMNGSSLALSAGQFYAVFYMVEKASEGANFVGVIPTNKIRVEGGFAVFEASHFGTYQLAVMSAPVADVVESETKDDILVASEVKGDPFEVDDITPIAAEKGKAIKITGRNFRPSMMLAINDHAVSSLVVKSDVAASFKMHDDEDFGFADISLKQDGIVHKQKLFALADRTSLPLITMSPSAVCSDVEYYDAAGDKQQGTKSCGTSGSGDMLKATYDTDANSKVDYADHAVAADYASGSQGTDITSQATITIPTAGSFFDVNGGTTISAIAQRDAGTRVTLRFDTTTVVQNSTTSGAKILLKDGIGFRFYSDELLELISMGGGNWREVARSTSSSLGVIATRTAAQTVTSSGAQLTFDSVSVDRHSEFASDTFTAGSTGNFHIAFNTIYNRLDNDPSCSSYGYYTQFQTYKNNANYGNLVCTSTCSTGVRTATCTYDVSLTSGETVKIYAFPLTYDTVVSGSSTTLSIHKMF